MSKKEIKYLLGIDGGGTKTEFVLTDLNENEIRRIVLGTSNPVNIGIENTKAVLTQGITDICHGLGYAEISVFAGLAGSGAEDIKAELLNFLGDFDFGAYSNGSDADSAVAVALKGKNGTAVIMGTRIIAFTRSDAEIHRFGGLITGAEIDTFLRGEPEFTIEHTKQFGKNVAELVLSIDNEESLSPAINIKTEALEIKCDNTALLLVRFLGVLNNDISKDEDKNISIISEVSYMELGNKQIGVYMIPGELSPELESGNFFSAEESANRTEADYKALSEMARCEHNFVLGLCNDELGYIIPENDFYLHEWLPYFNQTNDEDGRKHYEETNSLGPKTAGIILDAVDSLIASVE